MARPQKEALDYFSMDVEKDNKLKLLKGKFGVLGFGMYVELLQYIYKQGYYIERNEDNMLLFLTETGLKEEETRVMLEFMIDKDLFNRDLYEKYGILTSRGIQKRYAEGTRKRKKVIVETKFWIITKMYNIEYWDTETSKRSTITPKRSAEMTQSKVKESKVKKSIINNTSKADQKIKSVVPPEQEIEMSKPLQSGLAPPVGNAEVNEVIAEVKQVVALLKLAYDKGDDRRFARHIATAKEFGEFADKCGKTRVQLAVAVVKASLEIKYRKGVCAGPKSIYQNYADVYNKWASLNVGSNNVLVVGK